MSKKLAICDECQSDFYVEVSSVADVCPNCAHLLYGYKNCQHGFRRGHCIKCFWNSNISKFCQKLMDNITDKP